MAGVQGVENYIDLSDFTPGIHTDYFSRQTSTDPSHVIAVKDGAAQDVNTFGCCAGPEGGLIPLPRVVAILSDEHVFDAEGSPFHGADLDPARPDRIPIIAAKVVAPIQGTETPNLHDVTRQDDPLFYFEFEDEAGSTIIHNHIHREYDMVLGTGPDQQLGGISGGFGIGSDNPGTEQDETFTADVADTQANNGTYHISELTGDLTWKIVHFGSPFGAGSLNLGTSTVQFNPFSQFIDGYPNSLTYVRARANEETGTPQMYTQVYIGTVEPYGAGYFQEFGAGARLVDRDDAAGSGYQAANGLGWWFIVSHNTTTDVWTAWLEFYNAQYADGVPARAFTYSTPVVVASPEGLSISCEVIGFGDERVVTGYIDGTPVCTITGNPGPTVDTPGIINNPLVALSDTYSTGGLHMASRSLTEGNLLNSAGDTITSFSVVPSILDPLGGSSFYHGDFGFLAGGPIIGPVSFDDFTDGFAAIEDGVCGNAIALGMAYVGTPFADLYRTQFSIECRIKIKFGDSPSANTGGTILFKTDTNIPIASLSVSYDYIGGAIYNTDDSSKRFEASSTPGDETLNVEEWHDYVLTYNGFEINFYVDSILIATDNTADGTGVVISGLQRFEMYGDVAAFDEFSYYGAALSPFRLAVHFNSECAGTSAFQAAIAVAYSWFNEQGGATLVRIYQPPTAELTGDVPLTDFYDPFEHFKEADFSADVLKYGYGGFDLTRSNPSDPNLVGNSFLVALGGPSYDTDDSQWSLFTVPDPDTTTSDSQQEITDGFVVGVVCHQGRVVWIGSLTLGTDLSSFKLDVFERIGFTEVNDTTAIESNFGAVYVEENPTGYGSWTSVNAQELFLVKRHGGGVVVRGSLGSPTVVRLPGVASTGRFINLGVHTPYGYVYGSEKGVWLWTGGDVCTQLSPQLSGDFLDADAQVPDIYLGLRGSFTFVEPFIYAPNSWVFDTRTEAWFRLRTHPSINNDGEPFVAAPVSGAFPARFFDRDLDGNVYAFSGALNPHPPTPYSHDIGYDVVAQVYDTNKGESRFSWTSQPLARTRNRELRFREILLVASGHGTVTITLTGLESESTPDPAVFTIDSDQPIALRSGFALDAHDVVCRIESESSDPDSAAPYVHRVSLGYNQRQGLGESA